jgi:hypothetical protein
VQCTLLTVVYTATPVAAQLTLYTQMCTCIMQVPDVRFFKQTGDVNMIPYTAMIGTGGYIAAEIFAQKSFGKPADLWSVGKLMHSAYHIHH